MKHFISLTDAPSLPDFKLLGQFIDEDPDWPHHCVPECDGYNADNDSFMRDVSIS